MNKGFSLIELLAVIVIIGIITTFAYPGYHHYIIRAHRSDGQTSLLDLANRLERYYTENSTYQTATIGHGKTTDVLRSNLSGGGWYTLSIANATHTNYTLLAIPSGPQAIHDTLCQTLTFDHLGRKGITSGPTGVPTGTIDNCW